MGSKIQFYNYLRLMGVDTPYAKRMTRLRNSIFGDPVRTAQQTPQNMSVVQQMSKEPVWSDPKIVEYYPRHPETHRLIMTLRDYGLFRDEHQDFKEEMVRLRTLRGKPPWNPKAKKEAKKGKK